MKELLLDSIDSPIGTVLIVVDDDKLCFLDYSEYEPRMMRLLERRYGPAHFTAVTDPGGLSRHMRDYFAGDMHALDTIPVSISGTPFQQQVWLALRSIPAGSTISYGALAAQVGRPSAYRAVGATNASNPIAIVLPCHRVIGANAALTGYAGGLERKQWLLQHESVHGHDVPIDRTIQLALGSHGSQRSEWG